jgi:membrane protein YqaA with SNARE-associated domain
MLLKILTVAALATFEIYAAIPAGFAFGLSPWTIFFASLVGGLTGVFVAGFLGERIRRFFHREHTATEEKQRHPRMVKIWNKYGVAGLGFLGTISIGAPITIAVALALKADFKKLLIWCCIGVFTRCIVFTIVGYYGAKLF